MVLEEVSVRILLCEEFELESVLVARDSVEQGTQDALPISGARHG